MVTILLYKVIIIHTITINKKILSVSNVKIKLNYKTVIEQKLVYNEGIVEPR